MRRDSVDVAFARALERDRRRDAAESAKRRAVEQRCDYGAFHQLVLGANLRPMERSSWFRDAARGPRAVDRFTRARSARLAGDALARVNEEALTERAPETIDEFSRAWRRLRGECDDVKSEYLFNIPTEAFEVVFKVELALDVLIDFVRLIASRVESDERVVEGAARILCALTTCGRFESHARLAGADVARDALQTLRRAAPSASVRRAMESWGDALSA